VIAVDDRSTDQTGEIMERIAAASPGRLIAIHVSELPADVVKKLGTVAVPAEASAFDLEYNK